MRHEAINNLYPNVASQTNDLVFDSEGNKINVDEAKVAEEVAKLKAEYDSKQYQRDRKYPDLGEQFDLLFKDIDEGTLDKTGGFYTAIKEVKDKHPKPSE